MMLSVEVISVQAIKLSENFESERILILLPIMNYEILFALSRFCLPMNRLKSTSAWIRSPMRSRKIGLVLASQTDARFLLCVITTEKCGF